MDNLLGRFPLNYRLLPIQAGILATFALVPIWLRLPDSPGSFDALYGTGFLIFWVMIWTIGWWLVIGLPGIRELRHDRLRSWWAFILLLLACWAFASWSWAYMRELRPEVTIGAALPFAVAALFAVIIACAPPPTRAIIAVLAISLLVNSLIAGWQVARQGPISDGFLGEFNIDPTRSGISVVSADGVRWLRPYGFLPHPNILAGFLTVGLLAVVSWVLSERRRMRWIGIGVFLIGMWGLLLTFSRSAMLGLLAGGFAILPILWPRIRQRTFRPTVLVFAASVIGAGLLFVALYLPFITQRTGLEEEPIEQRSVAERLIFADIAYHAILDTPVLGLGIGNFPWRASYDLFETEFDLRGGPVHQIFLSAWSELGIIGYVLIVLVLILGIEAGLRKAARAPGEAETTIAYSERIARATLLGGVIALSVIGLLDHYPWTLLHFQALWFGLLAAASAPNYPPRP